MKRINRRRIGSALALLLLASQGAGSATAGARLLIFGEQHDQPDQQRQVAVEVKTLAERGQLAALVLEMAEAPNSTAALSREAGEAQVREALQWRGWPWEAYAAVVMNAVRAGVPVWGGNLPRSEMRGATADASLDARIDAAVREALAEAVRSGHCNLLPAAQEPGMVRIQIARDRSMAAMAAAALRQAASGQTVLVLTGAQHASRDRGIPLHLQRDAKLPATDVHVVMFGDDAAGPTADERRPAVHTPQPDPCEALRRQLATPKGASAPTP